MSNQTLIAIPVEESTNILLSTVPSSLPTFPLLRTCNNN